VKPAVSVVLPTHNRPAWFAESLTSVLRNGFQDFEVIVSNNGEPEHTRRLQQHIQDPRVRWIEQDSSVGMLDNFLSALSLARGRYVALAHDDDRWSPSFLDALVVPLERHPEAVISFSDQYVMNERGEVDLASSDGYTEGTLRGSLREGLHQPFFHLVAHYSVAATSCVFRRTALRASEIVSEVRSFYGLWLIYLLARTGAAAYYVPQRLAYIRLRDEGDAGSPDPSGSLDAVYCLRRMRRDPAMRPFHEVLSERLAERHLWAGAAFLRQGARGEARRHIGAALRLNPTPKAVAGWAASWVVPNPLLARL
jgi:glycosyltransferase involved in cell wall biosynthesis